MQNNINNKFDITAINDANLKKLILFIYECRDKISKILEDSEIIVQSTETFYKTADGIEFRNKFNKFSNNFPIVLSNIKSYGLDLEQVLLEYKKTDSKSVDIFNN